MIDQLTSYLADVPAWKLAVVIWAIGATATALALNMGVDGGWSPLPRVAHVLLWPIALPYLALRAIWRRLGKRKVDEPQWVRITGINADGDEAEEVVRLAPYASEIDGTGSKPDAPWVTREEFERECDDTTEWFKDIEARLDALEAKPKQGEWRGWSSYGFRNSNWLWDGDTMWFRWLVQNNWFRAEIQMPEVVDATELHGTELDALVAEFLEWKGRQE